jgi:SRSO17 transposase
LGYLDAQFEQLAMDPGSTPQRVLKAHSSNKVAELFVNPRTAPKKTDLRTLAATIKARWICEQAHQQMKEELGLDHFEGRSWQGLHRHALMTMIAYAFLQHRRLATARWEKKNQRATASTNLARRAPCHPRALRSTTAATMPALPKMDLQRTAV